MRNKGFSFIEVLMTMTVIGILSYSFMSYRDLQINAKVRNKSKLDYIELTKNFLFILSDDRNCSASLANYTSLADPHPYSGSISFYAGGIKGNENIAGVALRLFHGNLEGVRISEDPFYEPGGNYGNIQVKEIKLYLPDYTGLNLSLGYTTIQSEVFLSGEYRLSKDIWREFPPLKKIVNLNLYTESTGESFVIGCGEINKI